MSEVGGGMRDVLEEVGVDGSGEGIGRFIEEDELDKEVSLVDGGYW